MEFVLDSAYHWAAKGGVYGGQVETCVVQTVLMTASSPSGQAAERAVPAALNGLGASMAAVRSVGMGSSACAVLRTDGSLLTPRVCEWGWLSEDIESWLPRNATTPVLNTVPRRLDPLHGRP
jgi:hypothetical protein